MKRRGYEKIPEIQQHVITQTINICGAEGSSREELIRKLGTGNSMSITDAADNCTINLTLEPGHIVSPQILSKVPDAVLKSQLGYADQVLLTFNVNDLASLDELDHYAELAKKHAPNALVTLVGTQNDEIGAVRSITKAEAMGVTRKDVHVDDSDIEAFVKKHGCQPCIKVSVNNDKGIDELQEHLIESSKGQYLLNKIAALRTLAENGSLHSKARDALDNIASLLHAGINSDDPAEFFEQEKVKTQLDTHLKVLQSTSSSMYSTATNVVLTALSWLPAGIPRLLMQWCGTLDKNYKATGSHNMFSQSGHKQQAEKIIHDVREHAPRKGGGK